MFIDGVVDAMDQFKNVRDSGEISMSNYAPTGTIKTYHAGQCMGEECLEGEQYFFPYNLICR